jgi:hypothetical protein
MRGNAGESWIVGLIPSMAPTAKPPAIKPSTDRRFSRFPRAAPWTKLEIPKVLPLRERRVCTGRARATPPRRDWRGVEPGSGIVRVEMYAYRGRRKRGKKERTLQSREKIFILNPDLGQDSQPKRFAPTDQILDWIVVQSSFHTTQTLLDPPLFGT